MRLALRGRKPALLLFAAASLQAASISIDASTYLEDVKFLASQEMRGRGTGTPELEQSAAYIAGKFREFGLKPQGDAGTHLQAFQVTTNARLGKQNRFRYSTAGKDHKLVVEQDFLPFNFSSSGKLGGTIVFAGYGITAPEYGYDDYVGLDVKGRIVVVLRHEPQEYDEKSVFAGRIYTQHAQFASKASNARMHGAIGVIMIADRGNHRGQGDDLESFGAAVGPMDAGIPFVQVKAAHAEPWFQAAGRKLEALQEEVDKDLKPRSFAFPDSVRVDASIDIVRAVKTVHNVAGYLPGESDEYVVVGAHYDHLGLGEQFSMAPALAGTVHPGADDNASGTAGVLELARRFSRQPKSKRGILFLAFAGEELGLLGSSYFVNHPTLPIEKAVAMINMDMIGRVREGKVYVGGLGTGSTLREVLDRVAPRHDLKLDYTDTTGYGSSDHTSFTTRQVPVVFFFSGLHSDYHRPSDTWDKIDAPATARLLSVVADVAEALRDEPGRPAFVKSAAPAGAPPGVSGAGGYGPYFGSIPDFAEGIKGVKFAEVRDGSPAALAGLRAGDVMIEFDGKSVQNLYDFTYALRGKKPGEEVTVKVLRDGATVEARVRLAQRR